MTKHFYAAHNTRADLQNGNHGFANTWEVSRFATRKNRDKFVVEHKNRLGKPVSRDEAIRIWKGTYLCVGENVPAGGLFGADHYGQSNFWNEYASL